MKTQFIEVNQSSNSFPFHKKKYNQRNYCLKLQKIIRLSKALYVSPCVITQLMTQNEIKTKKKNNVITNYIKGTIRSE